MLIHFQAIDMMSSERLVAASDAIVVVLYLVGGRFLGSGVEGGEQLRPRIMGLTVVYLMYLTGQDSIIFLFLLHSHSYSILSQQTPPFPSPSHQNGSTTTQNDTTTASSFSRPSDKYLKNLNDENTPTSHDGTNGFTVLSLYDPHARQRSDISGAEWSSRRWHQRSWVFKPSLCKINESPKPYSQSVRFFCLFFCLLYFMSAVF